MPSEYFGKETENLQTTVNGKKVKVKWDWAKFKSTEGYPVDDKLNVMGYRTRKSTTGMLPMP